ncbi:MAG: RidA family protein [Chitinophagaceae bacterium]|nr:RidA family protein [Chitinophagaceae bacterium]
MRYRFASGTAWEDKVGYSRAIRHGKHIEVAGTVAVDTEGNLVGEGDMYAQAVFILRKIERALHEAGGSLKDVIRTRAYVTDISRWEEFAKAHNEFFDSVRPVSTLVEVSKLIDPRMLIEIEVSAMTLE